jgi:nucleoside 2-deoxyribosyltransferase
MKKVYLAGPGVFRQDAKEHGKRLKVTCSERGFIGLYPLDNKISQKFSTKAGLAKAIFDANIKLIHECDFVIANLTPFRGPSADAGTIWECGYAKGLGKIVLGYTTDDLCYNSKVLNKLPHDGMMIEDFSLRDNLMIHFGVDYCVYDDSIIWGVINCLSYYNNMNREK